MNPLGTVGSSYPIVYKVFISWNVVHKEQQEQEQEQEQQQEQEQEQEQEQQQQQQQEEFRNHHHLSHHPSSMEAGSQLRNFLWSTEVTNGSETKRNHHRSESAAIGIFRVCGASSGDSFEASGLYSLSECFLYTYTYVCRLNK